MQNGCSRGKTKTVKVAITDWGTPDKELYQRWYNKLLEKSGANNITEANVVDYYRQNDDGLNGEDWYGNKYQWSVALAKAGEVCNYISKNYNYTHDDLATTGYTNYINEFLAEKHGLGVGGVCGSSNNAFAKFCRDVLGLNARTVAGKNHEVTVITYNGVEYQMDATPLGGLSGDELVEIQSASDLSSASAPTPEEDPTPEDEDLIDITDLVVAAEANELSAEATTSEDGANELAAEVEDFPEEEPIEISAEEVNWADEETQVETLDEVWVDADDLVVVED